MFRHAASMLMRGGIKLYDNARSPSARLYELPDRWRRTGRKYAIVLGNPRMCPRFGYCNSVGVTQEALGERIFARRTRRANSRLSRVIEKGMSKFYSGRIFAILFPRSRLVGDTRMYRYSRVQLCAIEFISRRTCEVVDRTDIVSFLT